MDRSCYYENIMNDPMNRPYFESLDPVDLELLTTRMDYLNQIGGYFVYRTGALGADCNKGEYFETIEAPTAYGQIAQAHRERATQCATGWDQKAREILENHLNRQVAAEKQETLAQLEAELREQGGPQPENINFVGPAAGRATEELTRYRAIIESRPDVYTANKNLINHLYQELYRAFDVYNEIALDVSIYQTIAAKRIAAEGIQDPLAALASRKQDSLLRDQDLTRQRIDDFGDALQFYFKESPLSDHAKKLLLELGQDEATLTLLDRQHKVRKIFLGEEGRVAQSNRVLHNADRSTRSEVEIRASAIHALGLRSSEDPAAKANRELCKDIYINLGKDYAQKFHDIENRGTDLSAVQEQMVLHEVGENTPSKYVTGGGVDAISSELLSLYGTYLNTEKSIQYLKFMTQTLQGAEVFSGDSEKTLAILSQTVLTNYGANFSEISKTMSNYQSGDAVRAVARESCRMLLALPALTRLSEEERAKLPEGAQRLTEQYIALLNEVQQKIDCPAPQQ